MIFDEPTHHQKLVAYCLSFEKDCGQAAADAYCKEIGYGKAVEFEKMRSHDKETLTMESHATCSPKHNTCDAFDSITCQVRTQTFYNPMEHGRALDGCAETKGIGCGQDAANLFCKDNGYDAATAFVRVDTLEETMHIGDESVCDPDWSPCSRFEYITCAAVHATPVP
eukprot:CAMPEP_0201600534 /NCGR_PEP_ID=MMETSP0492-20130828/1546_1 /ASSEMBLY_ACC=CAM_ASM_000837 /TAXON_ID=420259 /ORGANISM="Thalassiosira gravida, Strain GMp14c1" /LENGTH=167 /DNA_ID=CAMNT_0048063285 /DNA_START=692 /DNA_END=1195 /DNA_ORIENTATION=+